MDDLRNSMKKLRKSKKKKGSKMRQEFAFMQKKQTLIEPKPFKCSLCYSRFKTIQNLGAHNYKSHKFHLANIAGPVIPTARPGYVLPLSLRDYEPTVNDEAYPVMSTVVQRQQASRVKRKKRVPKHKWPQVIQSYENAFDKKAWEQDPNQNTEGISSAKQTISRWKAILRKKAEEKKDEQ